jgi:hypothetical protein
LSLILEVPLQLGREVIEQQMSFRVGLSKKKEDGYKKKSKKKKKETEKKKTFFYKQGLSIKKSNRITFCPCTKIVSF